MLERGTVACGRFEVEVPIGAGAFGVVYRARDRETDARVAIKTLLPKAFDLPDLVERFEREAEICAHLEHESIVRLLHYGTVGDPGEREPLPAMVLELVRGLPLGGLVDFRGPLRVEEVANVLAQVCDGLAVAHAAGIVHRDLKPPNLLVGAPEAALVPFADGPRVPERLGVAGVRHEAWQDLSTLRVKVVDFGLGKMLEVGGRRVKPLTAAGVMAGTPHYISPEQVLRPHAIDHRADLYGVAMLIYRLLAGQPAFDAPTIYDIAQRHTNEPAPPLPAPHHEHPIAAVYQRAAAKDPRHRYASAGDMALALRRAIDPTTRPPAVPPPAPQRKRLLSRILSR